MATDVEVPQGTDPSYDDGPVELFPEDQGGQLQAFQDLVGGKRWTTTSVRLVGGRVELEGDFKKGEKLRLYVEAEVRSIEFRDETDKATGQVVGSERRHKCSITGVERAE